MTKLKEIIEVLNPSQVIGNRIRSIREPVQLNVDNIDPEVIMWAGDKYYENLTRVKEGVIICSGIEAGSIIPACTYLIVENPRSSFRILLQSFFTESCAAEISSSAIIDSSAVLGTNNYIGHNVVIERDCKIGDNVIIGHNTIIKLKTVIDDNVKIGSNNVIGGVGFGYEKDEDNNLQIIPHIGNVVIEQFVEIGNCTAIDRAVMGSTIIRKNAKIDNLVHIAHGVDIGENSMVIGTAQIAGSVKVGKNCWIAPSSTIIQKVSIGDNATVGLGAVVLRDVGKGHTVLGNPARILKR
jgi:UDP-3-O-[3-hydroxymyristoyl] glucosamine N-acyltransferase